MNADRSGLGRGRRGFDGKAAWFRKRPTPHTQPKAPKSVSGDGEAHSPKVDPKQSTRRITSESGLAGVRDEREQSESASESCYDAKRALHPSHASREEQQFGEAYDQRWRRENDPENKGFASPVRLATDDGCNDRNPTDAGGKVHGEKDNAPRHFREIRKKTEFES
jgi:hypothetical protein